MTQLINEAKRFQELAGINEVKIQPPSINLADFLERNDDEVSEKVFDPAIERHGIPKEHATYYTWNLLDPSDYGGKENMAECSIESGYGSVAFKASFEPFSEEQVGFEYIDDTIDYVNGNPYMIAGRKVYILSTNSF
jgi:hypothetical protein